MIGSDLIGPTSLGAGATAKVQLGGADLVLPAWARSILAIRPMLQIVTPTVDEAVMASVTLESDDFSVQPYIMLGAPIQSNDGAAAAPFTPEPPWYPVNCPINGGDRIKIYGTPLTASTVAPYMSCQVIVGDKKPGAQLHAKIGAITATGTAASVNVTEDSYTLTGGNTLKELVGAVGTMALLAGDVIMGRFDFISNDLKDPTPLKLPTAPMSGILGTADSILSPGLSRAKVEVPISSPCLFTNSLRMALAPAGAGKFITGVIYQ